MFLVLFVPRQLLNHEACLPCLGSGNIKHETQKRRALCQEAHVIASTSGSIDK